MVTNMLLISSLHFFPSALALFAPVPVSSFSFSSSSLLLALLTYLWTAIRSPLSGCRAGLNKLSSFSLLSPEVIRTSRTEAVQLLCFCSQVGAHLGWIHTTLAPTTCCHGLASMPCFSCALRDRDVCTGVTLTKRGSSRVFSRDNLKPCLLLEKLIRETGNIWTS